MNHRKRRQLIKKEKRKTKRQSEAQSRCLEKEKEEQKNLTSPSYITQTILEEQRAQAQLKWEEVERERKHKLWLLEEQRALKAIQLKKEREEKEAQRIKEEEQKIREEWEERQKAEKEEQEKKDKELEEKKERQEKLLKEATANEKTGSQPWHNPIAPYNYGEERKVVTCPFFLKTGACRFAERCSRSHPLPELSSTVMFPGMYTHFELTQGLQEEHDTDVALEYEEGELYKNFSEFYEDIVPEFKSVGKLVQVKVCCNYEPHLRGNVYIQYEQMEDAQKAYAKFNGRWFGGKQLSCQFVEIAKWKMAICGLFGKRTCPKGKSCNFLHVFRNPHNEFWHADQDFNYKSRSGYTQRNHQGRYSRRSPSQDRYSRRSSSRDRYSRRSPSRASYSRRSYSRHSRSRSQSRERYRHRSRSRSRHKKEWTRTTRSRSRSVEKARNKSQSRSHSVRNSRIRSRSKSNSPKRQSTRHDKTKNKKSQSYSSSSESSRSRSRSQSHSKENNNWNNSEVATSQNEVVKDEDNVLAYCGVNSHHKTVQRRSRSSSRSSSSRGKHRSHKKHKHHSHKRRKHKKQSKDR